MEKQTKKIFLKKNLAFGIKKIPPLKVCASLIGGFHFLCVKFITCPFSAQHSQYGIHQSLSDRSRIWRPDSGSDAHLLCVIFTLAMLCRLNEVMYVKH